MARQNIDEEWKTDPRRDRLIELLKDSRLADGARVQLNWLILDHKGRPVPLKKFKFVKDHEIYIECGLAEIKGSEVHISGADRYAEFFDKQRANAAKPRKAKASQKKPKLAKASLTEPIKPSSSFSSSLSSSSSNSVSLVTNASDFIAAYCDKFKLRWGDHPHIQGKDAGIVGRLRKTLSLETFCFYLDAYFSMPDAGVVKAKHPLNLFELKMNEVVVWAKSGKFTTTREAQQADNTVTNALLLAKVKRGEA